MLSISFELVACRYHATPWNRHANEGATEWPPSPWRILRALLSTRMHKCRELVSDQVAGSLFSKLAEPPEYCLPEASAAHVRHYMPWKKNWKKLHEKATTLVLDPFISLNPGACIVAVWKDVELDAMERKALDIILSRLSYLGRAESWCKASVTERLASEPNCRMVGSADHPGSTVYPVSLLAAELPLDPEILLVETGVMRKSGFLQPEGTRWVDYSYAGVPTDASRSIHRQAPGITGMALFSLSGPVLPMITSTLEVSERARQALQSIYGRLDDGCASVLFSGRESNGLPLKGHRHAHYLPLDLDGDCRIDHIAVITLDEKGFGRMEQEALALLRVLKGYDRGYDLDVALLYLGGLRPGAVPLLDGSNTWESSTPFLPVRHPKYKGEGRNKRLVDTPEDQVRLELERRGFSAPASITEVPYRRFGQHRVRWLEFSRRRRRRALSTSGAFGFRMHFDEPVMGPILLGGYCHYGLGMFMPCRDEKGESIESG